MVDEDGVDVNVTDDWRSTMMANSAHDPFWRAKVSHEVQVNRGIRPSSRTSAPRATLPRGPSQVPQWWRSLFHRRDDDGSGGPGRGLPVWHATCKQDSLRFFFSGNCVLIPTTCSMGPYGGPTTLSLFGAPMTSFVGFEPLYGEHVTRASSARAVIPSSPGTVDLNGNARTGGPSWSRPITSG